MTLETYIGTLNGIEYRWQEEIADPKLHCHEHPSASFSFTGYSWADEWHSDDPEVFVRSYECDECDLQALMQSMEADDDEGLVSEYDLAFDEDDGFYTDDKGPRFYRIDGVDNQYYTVPTEAQLIAKERERLENAGQLRLL